MLLWHSQDVPGMPISSPVGLIIASSQVAPVAVWWYSTEASTRMGAAKAKTANILPYVGAANSCMTRYCRASFALPARSSGLTAAGDMTAAGSVVVWRTTCGAVGATGAAAAACARPWNSARPSAAAVRPSAAVRATLCCRVGAPPLLLLLAPVSLLADATSRGRLSVRAAGETLGWFGAICRRAWCAFWSCILAGWPTDGTVDQLGQQTATTGDAGAAKTSNSY